MSGNRVAAGVALMLGVTYGMFHEGTSRKADS